MNSIRRNDIEFGKQSERETLPKLNISLCCNMSPRKDKYSIFDFIDTEKKVIAELKSRTVSRMRYPTTMVGANKIKKGFEWIEKGYTVYICWRFTDCVCYFNLTRESFNDNWIKKNVVSRWDRGKNEVSDIAYIPVECLTPIK